MKTTAENKHIIHQLHLMSGLEKADVKKILKNLAILSVLNVESKGYLNIPFLGDLHLTYNTDKVVKDGKQASIETSFVLSDELVKNLGQVQDGVESEYEQWYLKEISSLLYTKIEEF